MPAMTLFLKNQKNMMAKLEVIMRFFFTLVEVIGR